MVEKKAQEISGPVRKKSRKVAIVHDFLMQSGGAEQVLREIKSLFPDAPVFTLAYDKNRVPEDFKDWDIRPVGWSQRLPRMYRWYKYYMPLYPTMIEQMDLREFDLVISSSYLFAKGILTRSETLHLCYCYTPMRQAWELYFDYKHGYTQSGFKFKRELFKFFYPIAMNYVRMWDRLAAERVDYFISCSRTTSRRIKKFYNRDSQVIYPPVYTGNFNPVARNEIGDYYLCLSRLVPYKRIDIAVEAFRKLDLPLLVAGGGPQLKQLSKIAGPKTEFLGWIDDDRKTDLISRCRALIFPGREDFGIVPVEAQASGRPVIAFGAGGAMETVIDGETGLFFHEQTTEALIEAMERFLKMNFDPAKGVESAMRFDVSVFKERFGRWVNEKFEEFSAGL
jgi:glycosyltransferase involved in cell wall biosynthesis